MRLGAIASAWLVGLGGAHAQPSADNDSPYRLRLEVDLPLFGLGAALSTTALLELPPAPCLPYCDPGSVNGFDRGVIGNYSEAAHRAADALVIGLVVLPLVVDAIDTGGKGWLADTTVFLETLVLTQAVTHLTKVAVRRPNPTVYNPDVPMDVRTNADSVRSFFSGHTATAFAAATAYSVTYWLRHPKSPWRWVVLGLGLVTATTVGILKVQAGYHFWSDVIVGGVAGGSVGALVPFLHRKF